MEWGDYPQDAPGILTVGDPSGHTNLKMNLEGHMITVLFVIRYHSLQKNTYGISADGAKVKSNKYCYVLSWGRKRSFRKFRLTSAKEISTKTTV